MNKITVEVCCGSLDDVIEAQKAGAVRVELSSALSLGGLTPSIAQLKLAKETGAQIMAMVRPREGGFCYTDAEFKTMLLDARLMLEAGADGIVFGFLNPDGTVDEQRCRAMIDVIAYKESVFHRAIDVTPDWKKALDLLIDIGVTRVLTSGQAPTAIEGADVIGKMIKRASGRIDILPGSGIRPDNVRELIDRTSCNQVHASMRSTYSDTSVENNMAICFSAEVNLPDNQYRVTDCVKVRDFFAAVE